MQCFSSLINITIEANPVNEHCKYLRQFIVYRFNNLRYLNKTAIDYADLQKAKQVFNSFDKILQIPGQLQGKKREVKNPVMLSKQTAEKMLESASGVRKASKDFERLWLEVCQELIS